MKSQLGIHSQEDYVIAHWRRGDQVTYRCGRSDNSTNCDPVEAFVTHVNKEIHQLVVKNNIKNRLKIYIATNEWNATNLQFLRRAGYILSSDIKLHLNALEIFVVELQLMIFSKYLLQWGVSSIHDFVKFAKTNKNPPIIL